MKFLYKLGSYLIFIRKAFSRPEKRSVYTKEVIVEFEKLGLNSIVLVVIISFFIGAVLTLQTRRDFVMNPEQLLQLLGEEA